MAIPLPLASALADTQSRISSFSIVEFGVFISPVNSESLGLAPGTSSKSVFGVIVVSVVSFSM